MAVDATLLNYRRRNWRQVEGRVLATRYVAFDENVYPTAVVSYFLESRGRFEKSVRLAGLDFGAVEEGSFIKLLVHPLKPARCTVDG
ncbi:hypothetical protein HB771_09270 [Rhizobium leguminosarum bv. viciae]|nr:hypothetical protein HB771_09270 [Rhizobium leguminosarum bv. viciae]